MNRIVDDKTSTAGRWLGRLDLIASPRPWTFKTVAQILCVERSDGDHGAGDLELILTLRNALPEITAALSALDGHERRASWVGDYCRSCNVRWPCRGARALADLTEKLRAAAVEAQMAREQASA